MRLVQLFVPLYGRDKQAFPRAAFDQVRAELTERFGGVTAFVRSPAVGIWKDENGDLERDDVILFEILCEADDRDWWRRYRETLAIRFAQEEILVLSLGAERL